MDVAYRALYYGLFVCLFVFFCVKGISSVCPSKKIQTVF